MLEALEDRYPIVHHLEDGATITCSLMSPEDREALSQFLTRLGRRDLAYLQMDITDPEVQTRWMDSIAEGKSVCICAYDPKSLVGYASVQLAEGAGRHPGEIRVNISKGYRSRGLGRILISEIFQVATRLQLQTVTARMLCDQYGAKSAFERLGFSEHQILEDYVKDSSGDAKDLLVMTASPQAAS